MDFVLKTKITSKGWHFNGKTSWKSSKKGQSRTLTLKDDLKSCQKLNSISKIKKRKILERFQDIIENNYQNNENTGDYSIYDPAVSNLQRENFGATPES